MRLLKGMLHLVIVGYDGDGERVMFVEICVVQCVVVFDLMTTVVLLNWDGPSIELNLTNATSDAIAEITSGKVKLLDKNGVKMVKTTGAQSAMTLIKVYVSTLSSPPKALPKILVTN